MKKSKTVTEKKPMGRPRKHSTSAITCVVKLPPEVVRWIDARYTTRQEGLSAIVQLVMRHGGKGVQHF